MKKLITVIIAFAPAFAFAGKEERDYFKSDVAPAVTAAEGAVKSSCGCGMKFVVDQKSVASMDSLHNVKSYLNDVSENLVKNCGDAEGKKAICKLSSVAIASSDDVSFKVNGSKGTATVNDQSKPTVEQMIEQLDK